MTVDESEDGKEEADERMDMVEDGEKDWWKTAAVAAAAVGAAVSPGAWDYAAAWRAQLLAFFSSGIIYCRSNPPPRAQGVGQSVSRVRAQEKPLASRKGKKEKNDSRSNQTKANPQKTRQTDR